MQIISTITNKIRLPVWWYHLVPPIFSVFYAIIYAGQVSVGIIGKDLLLFIISIIGAAGFGYWLNDWTDLPSDSKVGKLNHTAGFTGSQKSAVLGTLLAMGWLPWLLLPATTGALIALALLHICFLLYSVPPFRLKEKGFWGVFCDIHYGHILPIAITLATFIPLWVPDTPIHWNISILLLLLLYLKGFRNIVEHQISDRKNDRVNHINTFVIRIGPLKAARLLSFVLVPFELLVIAISLLQWQIEIFAAYLLFLILYVFLFQRWGVFRLPWRHRWFKCWYIANDFYEGWLPLSILVIACAENGHYFPILILHIILFSKNFQIFEWLWMEIKAKFLLHTAPLKL